MSQYIVLQKNIITNFTVHGPFKDAEDAEAWATTNIKHEYWDVLEIKEPNNKEQ
jgi:hypothetical protein